MCSEGVLIGNLEFRKKFTGEYLQEIRKILDVMEDDLAEGLDNIVDILLNARKNKRTIFVMGNGGSASTASHFVGDLSKGTAMEGFPRFKAISLTDNIPNLLAWANDKDYEDIFVEQLKNLMEPDDVVIGISGSGNSKNVLKAIKYANENDGITIGLSGYDGGNLLKSAQGNIHVPSHYMQRVEDIHLLIEHLLTSMIREEQKSEKI
jgi:D-sedoheptulose 7-phosphate isomerase